MSNELKPDPARDPLRLATLMEEAPVFLAILAGPEHTFVSANRNYRALIGGRDPLGLTVREALPEIAGQGFFELLDNVYNTGIPFVGTAVPVSLARGDEGTLEEVYLSFVYQPTHDAAGAIDGVLVTGYEVTAQVRAQEAAQVAAEVAEAERAYLEAVLAQLPAGVIIATVPEGRILHYNARAEALLGHPVIPVERPEGYVQYGVIHADDTPYRPEEHPLVRAVVGGETILEEETRYRRGDGEIISLSVNAAPVRNANGSVTTAVAAFSDLTLLKELERTRETFLAAVAHDLKTPLTTIRGLAQLLLRGVARGRIPEAATLAARLEQIVAATDRAAAMVGEQLDLARVRAGQALVLERRAADLSAIVRRVVEEQQTAEARIQLTIAAPSLPGDFDPPRLERAIGNVVSNALKYSPGATPVVITVAVEERDGALWAVLTIADRGVGIPAEDLPRLGEHFYRAGNVIGRITGTGLGIASARESVAAHGGTLAVASTEGVGTTVTIRLPLLQTAVDGDV